MFQKAILAIFVLIFLGPLNLSLAQPKNPVPLVPPAWPTLAVNANKEPSCVFWTPPVTGAKPEYFCAVIVADPEQDEDTNNRAATAVLLAVRIDPATGTVSVGPNGLTRSIILSQKPDGIACTVIPPVLGHPRTVQCLYDSVQRVGWDGTTWWSVTIGINNTAIQGPGPDQPVTSNMSCVPWIGSATTTCFGVESVFLPDGSLNGYQVNQWTKNGTVDWAKPSANPKSGDLVPTGPPDPNRGPLVCSTTAPAQFACVLIANQKLFQVTGNANSTMDGITWSSGPTPFVAAGVNTGQACITFPSSTATPARTDCFFGDGGLITAPPVPFPCDFGPHGQLLNCKKGPPVGLFWAPDNGSRPVQMAMIEKFFLKAAPSCIGWSAGQIECFFPNKAISDVVNQSETDANIFHVLSYNTDAFATRQRLALASVLLQQGVILNTGFWQESLGVAAPTTELGTATIRGHTVRVPVANPKTLTSFACFNGPQFQSLCVAGLIDSRFGTPSTPAAPTPAFWATRRLVFKLVGNPLGVAPQEPTPVVKVSGPVGGKLKR